MTKKSINFRLGIPALRSRNYQLFFAGQGISLIGTWMTQVASIWLVYQLTNLPPFTSEELSAIALAKSDLRSIISGTKVCLAGASKALITP